MRNASIFGKYLFFAINGMIPKAPKPYFG